VRRRAGNSPKNGCDLLSEERLQKHKFKELLTAQNQTLEVEKSHDRDGSKIHFIKFINIFFEQIFI